MLTIDGIQCSKSTRETLPLLYVTLSLEIQDSVKLGMKTNYAAMVLFSPGLKIHYKPSTSTKVYSPALWYKVSHYNIRVTFPPEGSSGSPYAGL